LLWSNDNAFGDAVVLSSPVLEKNNPKIAEVLQRWLAKTLLGGASRTP